MVIDSRSRDIGGFAVGRVLPARARRSVGPFVLLDHMGPHELAPGSGMDVLPHPHIGLATVTYLFDGEILHRDSLGSAQVIRPGAVNWMTAGRGIAHSERTPGEARARGSRTHGLQFWVALPREHEETEPGFAHHAAESLPRGGDGGVRFTLLAGAALGAAAPARVFSPMFYLDAQLPAGASLALPGEHAERAAYVVEGAAACGAERIGERQLFIASPGSEAVLRAERDTHVMLFGGAPLDGPRHMWWNFVSSSAERIEEAKRDWAGGRFARVAGDEQDFVPLPSPR